MRYLSIILSFLLLATACQKDDDTDPSLDEESDEAPRHEYSIKIVGGGYNKSFSGFLNNADAAALFTNVQGQESINISNQEGSAEFTFSGDFPLNSNREAEDLYSDLSGNNPPKSLITIQYEENNQSYFFQSVDGDVTIENLEIYNPANLNSAPAKLELTFNGDFRDEVSDTVAEFNANGSIEINQTW